MRRRQRCDCAINAVTEYNDRSPTNDVVSTTQLVLHTTLSLSHHSHEPANTLSDTIRMFFWGVILGLGPFPSLPFISPITLFYLFRRYTPCPAYHFTLSKWARPKADTTTY